MIIKSDSPEEAGHALYGEMDKKVPLSKCKSIAHFVDDLPREIPMGISEKRWRQKLIRDTRKRAVGIGLLSGGWLMFILQRLIIQAITIMVKHYINKKGWV